ncbi:MAG: A24 family peptidase C-terminal domain-containing protein [Methanomicrobium sp.]|nr:A24 family peptidase C-terminal domain-containing protein [Methanomicrobium sp.]MDD4299516.1 A24 family peptidase C-terminal domain-containing protein [Methanomicrobium sp.]
MIEPLLISSAAIAVTLVYASVLDLKERRVPFKTWYPMLIIGIPMALLVYFSLLSGEMRIAFGYIFLTVMLCFMFYFSSAYLHLFGGADAWAFIFITALIPLYPLEPYWGYPVIAFFPLSVLINAVVLNIATPVGIFIYNIVKGNKAPIFNMFVGYPVDGKRITESFGFIMENFEETEDGIKREYISFPASLKRMFHGKRRMYTQDLKKYPDEYKKELEIYKKSGKVWISFGVPFIIPITSGFITALFAGDILYELMKIIAGVI